MMSALSLDHTAVVTVTYNSSSQIDAFLSSLQSQGARPSRIVVADNRSNDVAVTRGVAAKYGAVLLELESNLGYGGAINAAVATLPPSVTAILISNPDVEFGDGAIAALLDSLSSEPTVAAVGPQILNSDGTIYPSARNLPSLRTGIGHALFSRAWPKNPWTQSYRAENEEATESRLVGWLSGACLLVRRSAFEELNGFDEGFFMYFEDVDLGYRLGKAGWKNRYTPSATVIHTGAHSTSTESSRMLRAHHDSAYRYLEKKYSAFHLAPVRWILRGGLALRSKLLSRSNRPL